MHIVYIFISVLMNYDFTTHPILPFITINTQFLSKHCSKSVLDTEMNGYHCFNFTEKTFLRSVDPKQPKNVNFSLWSIIEIFPRGGAWCFRRGAIIIMQRRCKTISGGGCAPPHTFVWTVGGQTRRVATSTVKTLFQFNQDIVHFLFRMTKVLHIARLA
jgi:hypothetical protein